MNMDQIFSQAGQFKDNLDQAKRTLERKNIEVRGGRSLIAITVNGLGTVTSVQIDPDAISTLGQKRFEEELAATINLSAEQARKMASKVMEDAIGFDLSNFNNIF